MEDMYEESSYKYIKNIPEELGFNIEVPTTINFDNMADIMMVIPKNTIER